MITFLLILVLAGFILFLFNRFVPLDDKIKSLINYIVIFVLVMFAILAVLDMFGIYNNPIKIK